MKLQLFLGQLSSALWLPLGRWLDNRGLSVLAETCFRHGADGAGKRAALAGFQLSQRLLARGQNVAAADTCLAALTHDENNPRLWCALGAARRRMAEMKDAREAYEKAITLDPRYAEALSNLGEWFLTKGEFAMAVKYCDRTLTINPHLLEALNNRSAALYELSRYKEAEETARLALKDHPDSAALHVNLGNILLHTGKARLALKEFRRAAELDPTLAEAQLCLASMLGETHRLAETLELIQHQIRIHGETAQRLASLAHAYHAKGDLVAAEETCKKVLKKQAGNISALVTLSSCKSVQGEHKEAIELIERALTENPDMSGACSNIAFNSTYLPLESRHTIYGYHTLWSDRFEKKTPLPSRVYATTKLENRPLRIGYVSGDFGQHPVGFLLRDVIQRHDQESFYIHCYSMMRTSDNVTEAIRGAATAWIDALLLSDDELEEQILNDRIDILIDLSGHTAYNRLAVFTRRPAPVSATWIGYFHSTGLDRIDYFITDPHTSPSGDGQLFSETPIYLPTTRFCYSPPAYAPEVTPPPSLTTGTITFGSFNRLEKLSDPVIDAWARILDQVPGSHLLLKSGNLQNDRVKEAIRNRFVRRGLAGDRLDLRGPSDHSSMLAEYNEIDIALDPFPFNGGMTTLEALWMGAPVVTIAGNTVVSRQTISALANIGLADELAFPDVDAYINGAIALAQEPTRLNELRRQLRPRMESSPLRQPERFTRDLEALYRRMWQAWCRGEKLQPYT